MLSVENLNIVLKKLNERASIDYLGKFSRVDIVFIAGIFLWYQKEKLRNIKIPFFLEDNKHRFEYYQYIKQIKELYDIELYKTYELPLIKGEETLNNISIFSRSFAPIIYISFDTIKPFFGLNHSFDHSNLSILEKKILTLKENYIDHFKKKLLIGNKNEKDFFSSKDTLIEDLEQSSSIQTFVYTILYEKIKPFTGAEKKGKAKKEAHRNARQLWLFAEEYCKGIYELAKNILEHSSDKKGIITVRVYDDNDEINGKQFETHIFDFGEKGIIHTLLEKTKERKVNSKFHTNAYDSDIEILEGNYNLENFIEPSSKTRLNQQIARSIAHYGLMKFYNLIKGNKGSVISSSIKKNTNERDKYCFPKDEINESISLGTNYFFQLKFNPESSKDSLHYTYEPDGTLDAISGLSELLQFKLIDNLDSLKKVNHRIIIQYNINNVVINVSNRDDEELLCNLFSNLNLYTLRYVSVNFENVSISSSSLLRLLAYLSENFIHSFILYNVSFTVYEDMLRDNEILIGTFDSSLNDIPYWYEGKGVLIFSKVEHKKNIFNFANILYGQRKADYQYINTIVSHTFPNIVTPNTNFQANNFNIPICVKSYFHKSSLLPFDLVLFNSERGKTLFQSNLETLVSQEFKTETKNSEIIINTPQEYLESLNGYKISETHFKIGAKLHSEDFYYAKRLFSNSYYTARIALQIAMMIQNELNTKQFNSDTPLTLAGYERYSELLLSLTQKFLNELNYKNINRITTIVEGKKMIHLPDNSTINEYVVVIVPIASTGSTAKKIEDYILRLKHVKFPLKHYNILWARDNSTEFKDIRKEAECQEKVIILDSKWHLPIDCPLCFIPDKGKPLFETDRSSLIPSLIFTTPKAKIITDDTSIAFDEVVFNDSLRYKEVERNNENFLFSIDTEIFIKENKPKIVSWLKKTGDDIERFVNTTDKVVIISPCHESNAEFIDMVNNILFSSSATVIHYQTGVDYIENFRLLYDRYFKNAKVFFVDDTIISGNTFFQFYDIISLCILNEQFISSIFLHNKTTPEVYSRLTKLTKVYSFVNINLPPLPRILGKNPLEHETVRYKKISNSVLHDVLKEDFYSKAIDVAGTKEERNCQVRNKIALQLSKIPQSQITSSKKAVIKEVINQQIEREKKNRKERKKYQHISMFKATHYIYEYFDNYSNEFNELLTSCAQLGTEGKIAMIKVLSQYPFISYRDVCKKVFNWHRDWINETFKKEPIINSYNDLEEFKFLFRRSVFLGNYQIVLEQYFEIIRKIFLLIEHPENIKKKVQIAIEKTSQQKLFEENTLLKYKDISLEQSDYDNIKNLHIFLLKQYVEIINQNSWCAHKINENLGAENDYITPQGKQFYRMLKIEIANVLNDFYSLIIDEFKSEWQNLYKNTKTNTSNNIYIDYQTTKINCFLKNKEHLLTNKNKYEVCDKVLGLKQGENYKPQFINYLWLKQFLGSDKENYIPGISYSEKINNTINKLKYLFEETEVGAFFIVTDNQNKEYLLYDKNSYGESNINNLNINKHGVIYQFLSGEPDGQSISYKTIIEYLNTNNLNIFGESEWKDLYALNKKGSEKTLTFLPGYSWLLMLRISDSAKDYRTLGLVGFYSKLNLHNDWLAKQLLMLLREDLGSFIKRHHKNDEFATLRTAETVKRFAYLAGHGRQTILRLASLDNYDSSLYTNIVNTMHKLQYLFATLPDNSYRKRELVKLFLPQKVNVSIINEIKELRNNIYKSDLIENEVELDESSSINSPVSFEFFFNKQLLKYICFELIINAKKNRFYYIFENDKNCHKNQLNIDFLFEKGQLCINFTGTGVNIPEETRYKINTNLPVKKEFDLEGLLFLHNIIKTIDNNNRLFIKNESLLKKECKVCNERCKTFCNSIVVTLNPMMHNYEIK